MNKIKVTVTDRIQMKYQYTLTEPIGKNFDPEFKPQLTPKQMLPLGVFGGIYMRDCTKEFPKDWFTKVKFTTGNTQDPKLKHYKSGHKKVGYIMKIQEGGFNGIVDIVWDVVFLLRIKDKSKDGKREMTYCTAAK